MTEVEAYPRSGALDRMRWPEITYMGPMAMYLRAGSQPVEDHGDWMAGEEDAVNARVVSLQLHERRCDPPRAVAEATARVGGGIEGDSHVAKTKRAVLLVDRATLDDLGLRPGDLREQITTAGLRDVTKLALGTRLRVGGITLEVNGECEPCTHIGTMIGVADPEELRASLVGRRGAVCTVVTADEPLRVGDQVEVLAPAIR